MIRRLLARLMPGRRANAPRIYGRTSIRCDATSCPRAARTVTRRLQEEGFKAFIVGGAVRDLLLGIEPKDFDIATDATPEQVKPLFRRAFIIGRRFRLVHVMSATRPSKCRRSAPRRPATTRPTSTAGCLSDNVYGSQAEDAVRRDFTINALYFDPATETIWDYVGGVADIRARRLKLIGPPVTRYREDPVRMLRAVRLAAKLGLAIDPKTEEPILRLAPLMAQRAAGAPVRRDAEAAAVGPCRRDAAQPARARTVARPAAAARRHPRAAARQRFIDAALAGTDARVREDKGVSPAFLFATLLWHEVLVTWNAAKERGERPQPALFDAMDKVLHAQAERIAIPRRFEATIKEIWSLQPRFEQRVGHAAGPPARASAVSRRLRFPRAARRKRRGAASARRLVDALPGGADDAREAMLKPDEAPKKRRRYAQPQASRRRRRGAAPAADE